MTRSWASRHRLRGSDVRTERGNELTLAFVSNHRCVRTPQGVFLQSANIIDLLRGLHGAGLHVVFCAPCASASEPDGYTVALPQEIEMFDLPFYRTNVELIRHAPGLLSGLFRRILPALRQWDIVGAVAPSGFGLATVIMAVLLRRRVFFFVRGNVLSSLRGEYARVPNYRLLVLALFAPLEFTARVLVLAGAPTFTMGPALAERYRGPRVRPLRGYARPEVVDGVPGKQTLVTAPTGHLIYVGRLSGEKGVDVLLHALSKLIERVPGAHLTIAGDGPDAEWLKSLTRSLGLEDHVTFEGHVASPERLREVYLSGGVLVVPSRTEGVPVAMLEGMALGRVVVATRVGSIPSIVRHGWNGLLVAPAACDELADALFRVISEPELALRLSKNAVQSRQEHSVSAQVADMLELVLEA